MSTRYSISLLPDPDFTARAYRARQLICGQYACWAAEMQMLHMPLSDYFPLNPTAAAGNAAAAAYNNATTGSATAAYNNATAGHNDTVAGNAAAAHNDATAGSAAAAHNDATVSNADYNDTAAGSAASADYNNAAPGNAAVADYNDAVAAAETALAAELERLADRCRRVSPRFPIFNRGLAVTRHAPHDGSIWLDFSPEAVNESLYRLQAMVADLLERSPAVAAPRLAFGPGFPPHIPLLVHAALPDSVFDGALEFARSVTDALKVSQITRAWRLAFTRCHSQAAGADWSNGRWASDLQWQPLASFPL